jgi:RNA polymerase sigma-B factor
VEATQTVVPTPVAVPVQFLQCSAAQARARGLASQAQATRLHSASLRDHLRRQRLAARDGYNEMRLGVEEARQWSTGGAPGPPGRRRGSIVAVRPAAGDSQRLLRLHAQYAESADPALRTELAAAYDSFARALARRFPSRRETPEDLAQVARVGLLYALDRFDPGRGLPFIPFARATIVGELKRHVRDRTWPMRVSRTLQEHYLVVVRAVEELTQELGHSPRIPELATRAGLTDEQVLEAVELGEAQPPLSFDGPTGDTDGLMFDPGSEDLAFGAVERRAVLDTLLARLSDRERLVLHLRFVDELTQAEIAKQLGVSQMNVSRLLARILATLRRRHQWMG